jgi:hypothetical protein
MNNLYIKFSLLFFVFCSLCGSLLGQTVTPVNPSTSTSPDGSITVDWYENLDKRIIFNGIPQPVDKLYFINLDEGTYSLVYQVGLESMNIWIESGSEIITLSAEGSSGYCESSGDDSKVGIRSVVFHEISKISESNDSYSDYTLISTPVVVGDSYQLSVKITSSNNKGAYARAWIDWNGDGEFNDSDGSFDLGSVNKNKTNKVTSISPFITIPNNAKIDDLRMRISVRHRKPISDPCLTSFKGEVEDYTLNVKSSLPTAICQDRTIQLDATGNANITGADINNGSSAASGIVSLVASKTKFDCSNIGPNDVTLTVTDNNSQVSTCTAIVTVEDNTAPNVITQDLTVKLGASGTANIVTSQIDNGSTDKCGIASMTLDISSFDCSNVDGSVSNDFALNYDGNDYVIIPDASELRITGNMSIEAWFKMDSNPGDWVRVVGKGASGPRNYGLWYHPNGIFLFQQYGSDAVSVTFNHVVSPGQWYHMAATKQVGLAKLFMDGVLVASANGGTNPATSSDPLTIGYAGYHAHHKGQIDEVRLWNVARTDQEIADNYNIGLSGSENGLVAYYNMEEGQGISLTDVSGNNHNGSLQEFTHSTVWSSSSTTLEGGAGNEVTLTVTDVNGNVSIGTAIVTVEDNVKPVAICQDITVQLDGSGSVSITAEDIDKGSTDNCTIASLVIDQTDFTTAGDNTVTLTVTDASGNFSTCNATVTIVDDDVPSTASININNQDASVGTIPDSLVQNVLVTGCLIAENVDYTGDQTNGIGYFEQGDSDFPLSSGVILSTGAVGNAIGPASRLGHDANGGLDFDSNNQDSDLSILAGTNPKFNYWGNIVGWNKPYYDAQVLEFDFIPAGNKLEFNYIFASEEYNGYACSNFNDGFAFILSGPGIDNDTGLSGQNIALTESGDQVSINNVYKNQCEDCPDNSEFYVEEIGGHSIAFDGRTKILTAKADVTSCETYHIKLIVYDRNDQGYNSAVFLEAKSFKSNEVIVENRIDGIDGDNEIMYRGCDKSYISFTRKEGLDKEYPFHITIGGTAQNGIDYYQVTEDGTKIGNFPEDVNFSIGQSEIKLFYMASNEVSGSKNILFEVLRGCPCSTDDDDYFKKSIEIIDIARIEAEAISNVTCKGGDPVSTIIIKLADELVPTDYLYAIDGGVFQEDNKFQGAFAVGDHVVTIKDKFSCGSEDITINIPEATDLTANAGIGFEMCEKDSKTLNGTGGIDYLWTCDKSAGLNDMDVTSSTPNISPDLIADTYTYTLTVSDGISGLCESSADVVVIVKPTPTIDDLDADKLEICSGNKINLTARVSNVNTPSYKWTPDAEISGFSEGLSVTVQPNSTVLAPRTFTFTVTEDICSASQSISGIKVNPNPTVSLNSNESNLCSNGSNGEISVIAIGGTPKLSAPEYTYSWSPNSNSSNVAAALAPNLYTVTVIDSKLCEAKLDIEVKAKPNPIGIFFK